MKRVVNGRRDRAPQKFGKEQAKHSSSVSMLSLVVDLEEKIVKANGLRKISARVFIAFCIIFVFTP